VFRNVGTYNSDAGESPERNNTTLTRSIPLCVVTTGTEEHSLAQKYIFKLIKPGYVFRRYSHYQAYLQSLFEVYMLNAYAMWDPSIKAKIFASLLVSNITYALTIYRVSHELRSLLRVGVPYVKLYRYNPKHLYPKLNGYGDNGKRSLKL
jgi:hypothetical protein